MDSLPPVRPKRRKPSPVASRGFLPPCLRDASTCIVWIGAAFDVLRCVGVVEPAGDGGLTLWQWSAGIALVAVLAVYGHWPKGDDR